MKKDNCKCFGKSLWNALLFVARKTKRRLKLMRKVLTKPDFFDLVAKGIVVSGAAAILLSESFHDRITGVLCMLSGIYALSLFEVEDCDD